MYFYILWDTCKLAFQLSVFTTLNKVLYCIVLLSWLSLLVFYHFCIVDIYVYFAIAAFIIVVVVVVIGAVIVAIANVIAVNFVVVVGLEITVIFVVDRPRKCVNNSKVTTAGNYYDCRNH